MVLFNLQNNYLPTSSVQLIQANHINFSIQRSSVCLPKGFNLLWNKMILCFTLIEKLCYLGDSRSTASGTNHQINSKGGEEDLSFFSLYEIQNKTKSFGSFPPPTLSFTSTNPLLGFLQRFYGPLYETCCHTYHCKMTH